MNIQILIPPTSVPRLTKMSKSAEEVSFRPALRGKWQQSPQTMQTIPPAAARVEMDQEEPEEPEGARPTKLTCGLLLHKLRVHCLLVTLLVTTLLLTLAWLACGKRTNNTHNVSSRQIC